MSYHLGVDTGGTFTDIALINESNGEILITKVPSTPNNPSEAVINGLIEITEKTDISTENISFFIHGSTVATNALLEQKGAKTALITTEGFRDVFEIGRQARPKLYDFNARKPAPLVPRELRFEVSERIKGNGEVLQPLEDEQVIKLVKKLKDKNVQSIAVCLINSFINPKHEKNIKKIIKEYYPEVFVTISSDVLPEFKEYERTSTVIANGYVMPKMMKYLNELNQKLIEQKVSSDLYIMQSNGGVITAKSAMGTPARTVLSGPSGGILAGKLITDTTPYKNLITIDMGGTSLDTALIDGGEVQYTTLSEVGGIPIKLPMIEMHTIGSGGGSIAWIDSGGALRVGPQSAGADPGPVSYNKGGLQPTVTDANVILGRINPNYILNGKMKMNLELAKEMMKEKIADPLGIKVEEAAEGILKVVNANMVRGIRVVSIEKGHDTRDFSLVAFGGAGPLHAMDIAKELGSSEIIIPSNPGIACAMGMLMADVKHDLVQTVLSNTSNLNLNEINIIANNLTKEALNQLRKEGFKETEVKLQITLDLRYVNQAYEMEVPINSMNITHEEINNAIERFHDLHNKVYGFSRKDEVIELVNIRMQAIGEISQINFKANNISNIDKFIEPLENRKVFFEGEFHNTNVYKRSDLYTGSIIEGPAVIEQLDSTIIIGPNQFGQTDSYNNLIIKFTNSVQGG
ncbi:hydantoinase/oxoprolinase family protein [Oceanobacillus aidingensis]|uniref:Hydantoinase/oxoprolinase family protein n=1 Tax=Oceanobacillus aidingensis TaxID=645964 RepID=A0ABV9JSZ4_9BACI